MGRRKRLRLNKITRDRALRFRARHTKTYWRSRTRIIDLPPKNERQVALAELDLRMTEQQQLCEDCGEPCFDCDCDEAHETCGECGNLEPECICPWEQDDDDHDEYEMCQGCEHGLKDCVCDEPEDAKFF